MRRRTFVGSIFAGLASARSSFSAQARASKLKAGDVPTRVFGKTGEALTVIGQAGGRFPLISKEEAKAIVKRAYDLGINYFDNAHRTGTASLAEKPEDGLCRSLADSFCE